MWPHSLIVVHRETCIHAAGKRVRGGSRQEAKGWKTKYLSQTLSQAICFHSFPHLLPSSLFTCRYGPQQGSQGMMTGPNAHHSHHHAANDFPSGSSALNAATVVAAATATATATARVVAMQESRQHQHHHHPHHQHQQDAMHGMGINSMNSMGNGINSHMNMSTSSVTGNNNMNNMSTQGMHYQQQQQVNEPVIDMLEIFLSSLASLLT